MSRLIDADKLKEHYSWWHDMEDVYINNSLQQEAEDLDTIIDVQPTVDPVQHGRWVDDYNAEENPFFRNGWKCSACGFRTSYGKPKYCMNCGAQMDGESNET